MARLSSAQEDYLETIHELESKLPAVRVSDIAERLGVRMPPVTRTVQELKRRGFVSHVARRDVRLTESGRKLAAALSHRHEDVYYFLCEVLGVGPRVAQEDTCQIEHGLSRLAAQKLHEFLEHFKGLDEETRRRLEPSRAAAAFEHLPTGRSQGWRA